ncbi:hypothetical protein BU17DRAFT_69162 [Hysterangium stoloniferum]|nr:hypothetical protein BU17DRAFT_69162 [Hysterangium stoloniferum]
MILVLGLFILEHLRFVFFLLLRMTCFMVLSEVLNTICLAEPILDRGIRCAGELLYGSTKRLEVIFADGRVIHGIYVVGADGAHSISDTNASYDNRSVPHPGPGQHPRQKAHPTFSLPKSNTALVETYYHPIGAGNVLLAGDAVHVHSPVGGGGMNLGICDADAAAHAISTHVKAVKANDDGNGGERLAAADEIFQRYSNSRHAIGKKVVEMTKGTALINLRSGWKTVVRNYCVDVQIFERNDV